jgi:hypothetical protein
VRTWFPGVVLGAIYIPANLVVESSVLQLLHSRYSLEHKLVGRGSIVTFFFIIIVSGGDRSGYSIDGVFSVPTFGSDTGAGVMRSEDTGTSSSPIRILKTLTSIAITS